MVNEKGAALLCLDLEKGCEALIERGVEMARRMSLVLHILYVLPESGMETDEEAMARLRAAAAGAAPDAFMAVRRGRVEDEIVNYAERKSAAVVILGHRHKARRERVYVGSTTRAVISLAPGPVLVIPIDSEK